MAQHVPTSVPADSEFHTMGRAGWSQYQRESCPRIIVDNEGAMKPPGYVLPQTLCTTGALFGSLARTGTAQRLSLLAKKVPRPSLAPALWSPPPLLYYTRNVPSCRLVLAVETGGGAGTLSASVGRFRTRLLAGLLMIARRCRVQCIQTIERRSR